MASSSPTGQVGNLKRPMIFALLVGFVLTGLVAFALRDTWLAVPLLLNAIANVLSGFVVVAWSWRYRRTPGFQMPRSQLLSLFAWAGTFGLSLLATFVSCISHGGLMGCFPLLLRP